MTNEKDENRIKIEDLPQAEQELTAAEAKEVQGGGGHNTWTGTIVLDSTTSHR